MKKRQTNDEFTISNLDEAKLSQATTLEKSLNRLSLEERLKVEMQANYFVLLSRLREKRHQLGLTQAELAKKSRIPRETISKIESGKRNVTVDTLMRLAKAMGAKLKIDFVT